VVRSQTATRGIRRFGLHHAAHPSQRRGSIRIVRGIHPLTPAPFAHFFSLRREEVVPQAVRPLALDRGRSTPLDSVSSPWPPVAERPTVVGHGRGAGVPPRRMLPGRARTYRLPGHRCQGCGPPFATNARAAGPVRRPEFRSPSPWCVAVPAPQVGLTCSSVGVSLAAQIEDRTFSPNFAPALPG
jgi:hypothetical protein